MPVTLVCQYEPCHKPFQVKPYRLKDNPRFCSARCMGLEKRRPDLMRDCAHCGEPFIVRKQNHEDEKRLYCGLSCANKATGKQRADAAAQQFWTHVRQCGHEWLCPYCCWPWQGSQNMAHYGRLTVYGEETPAHRRAWELGNERIMPPELFAAHYCHTPLCCNPMHLHAATPKENTLDSMRDNRHLFGSRNGMSKFVEADIAEVFRLHNEGHTRKAIGKKFDVHWTTIRNILEKKTWKHIQLESTFVVRQGRGKRLHPDTPIIQEAFALWRQSLPTWRICDMLGISDSTLYRYIEIAHRPTVDLPSFTAILCTAPDLPKPDRERIYKRDRGICHLCSRKVSPKSFTLDHLIPRSAGGLDIEANVAPAHARCNFKRQADLMPAQLRFF